MKQRREEHCPEKRSESLTVNLGTFNGTQVELTFILDATLWSGKQGAGDRQ